MGYNDIVCKFALYTFDLCDQPANEELVLKTINFVRHLYIFVYFMFKMKTKIFNAVKRFSLYYVHPNFPTFNMKMIEFCTLQIVTSTLSKALL